MPVRQYVYFALSSRSTSAAEMSAALGIEPDRTVTRGSRRTEPSAAPVDHRWVVECRDPGLAVDEQVARILRRLAPHTDAIAALARRLDGEPEAGPSAVLEVVRYFNEGDSEHQAPSLGWHLGRDVLDFLDATGAVLDVDEYEELPD